MVKRKSAAAGRREVAKAQAGGLPSALAADLERDAGAGLSTAAEDNIVPMVLVLQALSPQVSKRNPEYIEGAEPGHFLMKNMPRPVIPGEEGFLFQPCHVDRAMIEWVPRNTGGGFVARHDWVPGASPQDMVQRLGASERPHPENPKRTVLVLPNGNELVDTRYVAGLVHGVLSDPVPFVIPLSSSGHTVFREWNFTMNQQRLPNGGKGPMWAQLWRLKTRVRANNAGQEWFVVDPEDFRWLWDEYPDEAEQAAHYQAGKALNGAFESGAKVAEEPPAEETGGNTAESEL